MKKTYKILLMILIISCNSIKNEKIQEKVTLFETKNDNGQLTKRVISGYIPGEDFYLSICEFDTNSMIVSEYGARPYGEKFKISYIRDSIGRVIEEYHYKFYTDSNSSEFENYHGGEFKHYKIQDTLSNFNNGEITRKILYQYDDKKDLIRERIYDLYFDSLKMTFDNKLVIDTIYKTD